MEWLEIVVALMLAGGVFGGIWSIMKHGWNRWTALMRRLFGESMVFVSNAAVLVIALGIFVFVAPVTANEWLFQGVVLHWPHLALPALTVLVIWLFFRRAIRQLTQKAKEAGEQVRRKKYDNDTALTLAHLGAIASRWGRRALMVLGLVLAVNVAWIMAIGNVIDYATYQLYAQSKPRDSLVLIDPDTVRYTPREVAHNDISFDIKLATEDALLEYTRPIVLDGHFGYITPVTPDGFPSIFTKKVPGFQHFDDSPEAGKQPTRIVEQLECGSDMLWRDNLERKAYLSDFFAVYDTPHYIRETDKGGKTRMLAVMPKVSYRWFMFPHWDGAVIVDSACDVKSYTARELRESRYATNNQWLAPMSLARHYVEIQNYAAGFMAGFSWVRVDGKLEIPPLPGANQFPHLQVSDTGNIDLITLTKADGGGLGLYRAYYFDASTFELTHYEFPQSGECGMDGPTAALKQMQNVPGYNWHRVSASGTESGNMVAIEPVFIPRSNCEAYWKFTITNMDRAGISGTAIADARDPDGIVAFRQQQRTLYESWLRGGDLSREQLLMDSIKRLRVQLREAESELGTMEQHLR